MSTLIPFDPRRLEAQRRARVRVAALVALHRSIPGHVWDTEPLQRACVRCGLEVHTNGAVRRQWFTVVTPRSGHRTVVLEGSDVTLPPCTDGAWGEYRTAQEAAPAAE